MPTRIVDLTLALKDGLRTWDIKPPFTLLPYMNASTFKLGFSTKLLVMEDHTGTHVDASLHSYDGARRTPKGRSIAELPLEKVYGDAVCIDVSAKRADEPVTAEMLAAAVEKQDVEIRKDDIVLVRFWSGTWGGDAFLAARASSSLRKRQGRRCACRRATRYNQPATFSDRGGGRRRPSSNASCNASSALAASRSVASSARYTRGTAVR